MANEATGAGAGRVNAPRAATAEREREADTLSAQVEALKNDVSALTATLAELVKSSAREGRGKVEQKADEYYREGRRQAEAVLAEARAMEQEFEEQIGRNPLTAVLIALGLGFLIGLMSRR